MAYATVQELQARMQRELTETEQNICESLLEDAAVIIDAYNENAKPDAKRLVSLRMVRRSIGDGTADVPIGATQGSMSALGYSQSWTIGSGTVGELYIGKEDKKLLGASNKIGSYSPTEALVPLLEREEEGACDALVLSDTRAA
jgi:hypothetical protein